MRGTTVVKAEDRVVDKEQRPDISQEYTEGPRIDYKSLTVRRKARRYLKFFHFLGLLFGFLFPQMSSVRFALDLILAGDFRFLRWEKIFDIVISCNWFMLSDIS